jgi:hypothetical protein
VWTRIPAALLLACALPAIDAPSVRRGDGYFQVEGWSPGSSEPAGDWQSVLSVYAGEGELPPVMGSYSIEEGRLTFRPRFPLAPDVAVRAVFQPPGGATVEARFDASSARPRSTTRVANVYPTVDVLPENQLKFYFVFTSPMQRGEAWRHISLTGEDGVKVDLPFLEIDQELWDRDNTRLTVLFDPGRIKRGVQPLEEVGSAIKVGHGYTLSIGTDWLDARGAPLKEGFHKKFRVVEADREPIDPRKWIITPPRVSTRLPGVVDFGEPLDYALAQRMIEVEGMRGHSTLERNQTRWTFVPDRAWPAGEFRLKIDTALEDLAGNRVGRPFDVDVFEKVTRQTAKQTVLVPFSVRDD